MLQASAAGLLAGLTLIVAIGAQNAYVLRQGLLRSHIGPVVAVCALSDLILIAAGVSGIGAIVAHAGWVLTVVRWFGVAFLVWYAVGSLRRARHAESLAAAAEARQDSRGRVLARVVALTWLNPHVYLDTVLLLGSIAQGYHGQRWWFAVGAGLASIVWFSALGFGARLAAPVLALPRAWQVLEVLIGLTMLLIAVKLALG
ncbi:LysE/ArgO family amino acid transporter [Nocardioides sp. BP30]|uniref:LysE/ArgO family amino acid transporter n=1 Tax=Nocardioides sp. BP30 TaxID=3036374 RepID=UPI0024682434|nr:LysE/ArgO family amino acid transporter [Nocardioides sp. BP30]WGL52324.1 LysE/ArgO family amino acid transporter [Nocardioides sp. BP30]